MRLGSPPVAAVLATFYASALMSQPNTHRFNVRDSIEMTTFSNPAEIERHPRVSFSPDGSKFLVVTSRGEIATDKIHSELLMYDVATVRHYLSQSASVQPEPRLLATVASSPQAYASRPYAAVVTDLRWSSDSRLVYFLGQGSDGSRRLYRVDVSNSQLRAISPGAIDVREYAINAHKEVSFLGAPRDDSGAAYPALSGIFLNRDARVVTGLSLQQILFPTLDNGLRPRVDSLWMVTANGSAKVIATDHQLGGPEIDGVSTRLLDLSPDGRYVISILPVETIPASWSEYDPMPVFEQRRIDPSDPAATSAFNFHRVRAYFMIDLRSGRGTRLVDAPLANSFGYHDKSMVAWSSDGQNVMVTDTFLPMNGSTSSEKYRHSPCTAVSIKLSSRELECVVYSRDQYHAQTSGSTPPLQLADAHYMPGSADSAFLGFTYNNENVSLEEHYVRRSDGWQKVHAHDISGLQSPLSVYINQDLNTPPTLWAKDLASQHAKELLDPNPQLTYVQLGRVTEYRWKDDTGRPWEAGLVFPVDYDPSKRYPLVIQTHGFESFRFLSDGRFPTAMAARPLASAGMVVLQMGYSYDHIETSQELEDQLAGYRSAIDHLAADAIIDRTRVGIIGFSRPAWHVAAALVKAPELFAAATLADGVDAGYLQYMIFGEGNLGLSAEFEKINAGPPFGNGIHRWVDRSVSFHLDKVRAPVRIEAIGPVSLLSEWEDYSSLRQQGKPVDLVYLPNGQHILQRPLDRLASQEGNVAWFCFWLLHDNERAGCPASPQGQTERWTEMRKRIHAGGSARTHGGDR